ncbi:MAG: OmpA family protein [Terriglobia bacterium]
MRTPPSCRLALALAATAWLAGSPSTRAQAPPGAALPPPLQAIELTEPGGQILSFRHLAGSTVVEMKGTARAPAASLRLKVESRPGFLEIDIKRGDIKGLEPARSFGRDFLTYVLWAVSVNGEAMNLGELTFDRSAPVGLKVTTPYQTFWLLVTAEPDFAVSQPSPVVVLYSINQDAVDTENKALPLPGKLIYYTHYTRYDTAPAAGGFDVPNELLQARKAVELASAAGFLAVPTAPGEEPLPDQERAHQTLAQARAFQQQAQEAFRIRGRTREALQLARTATQLAENARALARGAVGGIYVRQLDRALQRQRAQADEVRAELTALRRTHADASAQLADSQRELAGLRDRLQHLEAALDLERRRSRQLDTQFLALRDRIAWLEQQVAAAQRLTARLAQDRDTLCAELRRQLASLGQLTEQDGDWVLTLGSDILFNSASYELHAAARENLAQLALLRRLLFPPADVRYEGHTDRVGQEGYNQWLSEQRALAVYRYFLEEQLTREPDPARRKPVQQRLAAVQRLLAMNYTAARRNLTQRRRLLAQLGHTVIGKGEREPVVDTRRREVRNRRVVLRFPRAQGGQPPALCSPLRP